MSEALIRILLVDDHPGVRLSTRTFLQSNPQFSVIGDCDNGHCAIEKAEELQPDIMLLDINMEPLDGFDVAEAVLKRVPGTRIIAFSINNQPKYAKQMIEMGAHGYLTKTSSPKEIVQSILDVHRGEIVICEEVRKYMLPPTN